MTARGAARRARNLLRHSAFELAWFMPIWLLLGIAYGAIRLVTFRRLAGALGEHLGPHGWVPLLDAAQDARARRIGALVRWVALHTPWTSDCFPQALVARLLLGLSGVPCTLMFGLEKDPQARLLAHAWVAAGRVAVTGGASFPRFTVVACFASLPARAEAARS